VHRPGSGRDSTFQRIRGQQAKPDDIVQEAPRRALREPGDKCNVAAFELAAVMGRWNGDDPRQPKVDQARIRHPAGGDSPYA
jgi:hypothetical protein